jgi:hypothetical protein
MTLGEMGSPSWSFFGSDVDTSTMLKLIDGSIVPHDPFHTTHAQVKSN